MSMQRARELPVLHHSTTSGRHGLPLLQLVKYQLHATTSVGLLMTSLRAASSSVTPSSTTSEWCMERAMASGKHQHTHSTTAAHG